MSNYVSGKSVLITGAASGFGRLVSQKAAALGGKVTCADINEDGLEETLSLITSDGGTAQSVKADVTQIDDMRAMVAAAIDAYGSVDVMVNNAGIMPLAFFADHAEALDQWYRCIDINFKGVLNGIVASHDPMIAQGHGHVINISSIYGNFPVAGSGVYQATKSAVNYMSESLRVESRGKIKVTTIKPTGIPLTGLAGSVVNMEAALGIAGQNAGDFLGMMGALQGGTLDPGALDPNSGDCSVLDPGFIADAVIHAINQPKGVVIGDITVRATGDHYVL